MKKYSLTFLSLLCIFQLFAQNTINLFKTDLSVVNLGTNVIDSLKFSNNNLQLDVYKTDNSVAGINISGIDSITFTEVIPQSKPIISNVTFSSILNTTVKCSFNLLSTGGTSIIEKGICWSTTENPTIENNKLISASSTSVSNLDLAGLTAQTPYFVKAYAINANGISYSNQATFTTANYTLPAIEIVSWSFDYSTNINKCVVKVTSNGGCALSERGICWSTAQNPTKNDSKYSNGTSFGTFYANMTNLNLNSIYYIRPFVTNCIGTTYGAQVKMQALMGNVTYSIQADLATTQPTYYNLIKTAMDSACWYFNRYTTFKGNIYAYYSSGIPTAQASYHGSIGFGSNTTYMWVGTAMHEMCHFMGSGTTTAWQNLTNGNWTGSVASALLLAETGEVLKGDDMHFWPYGVNYRSEITGLGDAAAQKKGLILCAKLCKAMCVDDAKLPSSW